MYKRQVRLQKIFCLLAIVVSAAMFLYSLGLVTDLHDALKSTMFDPNNPLQTEVTGAKIFYDIQPFNQSFMLASLGLILLALGLFITNTHTRRRYYIGNFVATALWSVAAVAVSVWAHTQIEAFKYQFQTTVDFEALAVYAQRMKSLALTADSTFWFDVHYVLFGLLLLVVVTLVANVFWKLSLMKQEAELVKQGQ